MTSSIAMMIIMFTLLRSIHSLIHCVCGGGVYWTTSVSEIPQEETGYRRYLKWVWLLVYVGVFISCAHCSLGVATPPEGKELGENDEPSSPNNATRFSPNMDSDYHSLSNAPILSPGKASIYGVVM